MIFKKKESDNDFQEYRGGLDIPIFELNFGGIFVSFKDIMVFFRIQKKATIKVIEKEGITQIKCPYCQNISNQREETVNYRCPFCHKKSYIDTSGGLSTLFKKRINKI